MNVSLLLRELTAHGVELEPEGMSLPAPNWPDHCPEHLRRAFAQNRRAIMARIALPVFVYMLTQSPGKTSLSSQRQALKKIFEESIVLVQIDDEFVIWLPGQSEEGAKGITRRLSLQRRGMNPEQVQIVTGRSLPSILRRAVRSGRAFCSWDGQNMEAAVWRAMRFPAPVRWIGLRDLARAGGWRENLDDLLWNLLLVRPAHKSEMPTCSRSNGIPSDMEVVDHWTTCIGRGLDQLLGGVDLYDRLRQYDEPELVELHHAINRHGIGLDVELAQAVVIVARQYAESQFAGIAEATNGTMTAANLLDDTYVLSWLQAWGLVFPNLNVETIHWVQTQMRSAGVQPHPTVEAVLHARLVLARQPIGSLLRALELVNDEGRIRNHMNYFANQVGEFSSRGIAFGSLGTFSRATSLRCRTMFLRMPTVDELVSGLPCGMSIADLMAAVVAECFVPAAGHFFEVCRWPDLDVEILGWMAGKRSLRMSYSNNSPVERVRQALGQQLRKALDEGRPAKVGKCQLSCSPAAIEIRLPSGRVLCYRHVTSFSADPPVDVMTTTAGSTASALGARLKEHVVLDDIVRAIRRDVVVTALLNCTDEGAQVVAHGPDFLILEVDKKFRERFSDALRTRLLERPEWANGLFCDVSCTSSRTLGGGGDWKYAEHATRIGIPL